MRASPQPFTDRRAAGVQLAAAVARLPLAPPLVVLGLPRGGVPVAFEVAHALHAPLDVMVVRKVGMPGQPELALGAIAAGGLTVRESPGYGDREPDQRVFAALADREREELGRRERLYRAGRPPLDLAGKTVLLVDDGLATGATMLAAVRAARRGGAASVVAAAPVSSYEAAAQVGRECDRLVVLSIPRPLYAVGEWYLDFGQVQDREVCELLEDSARQQQAHLSRSTHRLPR